MKKTILTLILCISLVGCNSKTSYISSDKTKDYETFSIEAVYVFDEKNKNEVVGFADYVFEAKIDKFVDYLGKRTADGPDEIVSSETYTLYEVSIEQSFKGDLPKGKKVLVEMPGGINEEGKFMIDENGIVPDLGKKYIFSISLDPEGNLQQIHGVPPFISEKNDPNGQKNIDAFVDACKNEVKFDRERFSIPK
ncbi:MAG: hypothetical protein ACRCUP_01390 [Mycoplasmatales bacterium]